MQHSATQCNTTHTALESTAACCSTLNHTATYCNILQYTATHCNTLQHTAKHCNTLQHTATHCNWNTLQHNTPATLSQTAVARAVIKTVVTRNEHLFHPNIYLPHKETCCFGGRYPGGRTHFPLFEFRFHFFGLVSPSTIRLCSPILFRSSQHKARTSLQAASRLFARFKKRKIRALSF